MSLVISRRRNETIHIGDNIIVTVVRIGPRAVRLAIDAPEGVSVHRSEVWDAIREEKEHAGDKCG